MAVAATVVASLLVPTVSSSAADPSSVTVVGSLQSELGCSGDWHADCAATHLGYDAGDDVWQGTFLVPAGSWEYKAAMNDSLDENYGLHAQANGPNIPLNLAAGANVKFYYDHKSHWITDNRTSVIAVAPGSFQSELGCLGRLAGRLSALLAPGPRWRRHLLVRDDRIAGRFLRDQGRDQ